MKLKLMVSEERYDEIAAVLAKKGIEISETADLVLSERNAGISYLIGRREDEIYRLKISDISHFESFSHDVIAYTKDGAFKVNERLKTLSALLDPDIFIRISNSVIISANHIQSIKPAFTQKFIVTMQNGAKVDVTRTYYYIFKEFLGI